MGIAVIIGIAVLMAGLIATCLIRTIFPASRSRIIAGTPPAGEAAGKDQATIDRLAEAIRYRTVSYAEQEKIEFAQYVSFIHFLGRAFPNIHRALELEFLNEYALLYSWPGTDSPLKPVLLMAHYDVVPAQAEEGWKHDPFGGILDDGYLYGRGTLDDKHCLMAIMEAVESLLSEGFRPRRSVYLCFGHDEEIGGINGAATAARILKDRGVSLEWVLDEGSMVHSGSLLPGIDAPVALIGITEKGHVDIRIQASATPGHAATPPPRTSVGEVAAAVAAIERKPFPSRLTPVIRKFLKSLAPYAPFSLRLILSNLWLFSPVLRSIFLKHPNTSAMVRTTQAATRFSGSEKENILPARAIASFNVRLLHGDTVEKVLARYRRIIHNPSIRVEPMVEIDYCDPLPVSSVDGIGFRNIAAVLSRTAPDTAISPFLVLGATDSRHFSPIAGDIFRFVPIRLTPEEINLLHGVNERISLAGYHGMIDFYRELIRGT